MSMEDVYKSVPKIIDFEKAKISHQRRSGDDICKHKHVCIDPDNETVECTDCGAAISPFYALNTLTSHWASLESEYKRRLAEASSIKEGKKLLKATQAVDKAWRSRKTLPTCPHCHRGISPDDWLRRSGGVSKEYDAAMRRKAEEKRQA